MPGAPFAQDVTYRVEIYGNNSATAQSYVRGTEQSIATNTYDLWVDGVLVGDDLPKAQLPDGEAIDSFMFYGRSSANNEAQVIIDDIIYSNGLVATPTQTADGSSGWRLLSVPVEGATIQQFVDLSLVQGIPGEFESAACGNTNLFTGYNGDNEDSTDPGDGFCNDRGFTPPRDTDGDGTAEDELLVPGRGVLWYLWADAFDPDPSNALGESESAGLPLTLAATGMPASGSVAVTFTANDRAEAADDFYFIGNPFDAPFDLSGVSATDANGSLALSSTFQTYEPDTKTWVALTATGVEPDEGDDVAVWQGFFAETVSEASLPITFTFDASFKTSTTPPFYGRTARRAAAGEGQRRQVAFTLAGETAAGPTLDRAATVRFVPDAEEGWDRHDASKLYPLTSNMGLLAPVGVRGGAPHRQAVHSLPYEPAQRGTRVPLSFFASRDGTFTLTWALEGVPADWQLRLRDLVTGEEVDLHAAPGHTFSSAALTSWTDRFVLGVAIPRGLAEADLGPEAGLPGGFALTGVSPNPTAASAHLALEVARAQAVTVAVYDVLGRRVALLHDGPLADGAAHAFTVDARALASGLYVVRVEGETFVETRRLTVMK